MTMLRVERREIARDLIGRVIVSALYTRWSVTILVHFLQTGRVTALLLLVSESLVVVLTVARRPARTVDRSLHAAIPTGVSIIGPLLLYVREDGAFVPDGLTAGCSAVGLVIVILAKVALGRSFGIAAANRGVVVTGAYACIRHPIYAGYLITHAAFLLAHPSAWNLSVLLVADSALLMRLRREEHVLGDDVAYQNYRQRVRWHLIPGVY
jgi:protein-S-isoprenylcysteine O-methyltransferase Ste14